MRINNLTLWCLVFLTVCLGLPVRAEAQSNVSPVPACNDGSLKGSANQAPQNVLWQWINRANHAAGERERRPWKALEYARDGDTATAMVIMNYGQDHNTQAQQSYQAYRKCLGDTAFWKMVASVSTRGCDIAEAKVNTDWQLANNHESMMKARSYRDNPPNNHVWAMAWILSGQGHNQPTQDLYRACFATNPKEFLGLF